jgi:assimilatory nitrate reductase catalytic subunit
MIDSIPRFMSGAFPFTGAGYDQPAMLAPSLVYTVPSDKRAQLIYLRGGNSSSELIYLMLMQDGKPMRTFPVGAKAGIHVPLAVVEDLQPDTKVEVYFGAPAGDSGTIVLDVGLIEI